MTTFSLEEHVRMVRRTEGVFAEHGIVISNGSSLRRLLDTADELTEWWRSKDAGENPPMPSEDLFKRTVACGEITYAISWLHEQPDLRQMLKRLLKDSLSIDSDKPSRAKDTAFEIATAARFQAAGYTPRFQEPDLVVPMSGGTFAVACKHIYSGASVDSRLREAGRQIRESGLNGLAVLGIDDMFELKERHRNLKGSRTAINEMLRKGVEEFCERYAREIAVRLGSDSVWGVLVCLGSPCIMGGVLAFSNTTLFVPRDRQGSQEYALMDELRIALEKELE